MILKSVRIQNFRSILDETLACDDLTALVGTNGAGKSAFLRALALFYDTTLNYGSEDFYNRDVRAEIEITVTFGSLDDDELARFSSYLQNDELSVTRVLTWDSEKRTDKYHGSTLQNPEFEPIKNAASAADLKAKYQQLQATQKYLALPKYTNKPDAVAALRAWEGTNLKECVRQRDDGQFFGFKEVAQGYLGRHTKFIYIPAVRDAADDAVESRGSAITQLMDLVVRSVLEQRPDVQEFKGEVARRYQEVFDPTNLQEIASLAGLLTKTLSTFVPGATVDLSWLKSAGIDIPLPKADLRLEEDGFVSAVERTGHGLQRAFILTLLQHLAIAQRAIPPSPSTATTANPGIQPQLQQLKLPNLILGIEEPELYQHPDRERHLV